jgi:lipoate-protein ligase A
MAVDEALLASAADSGLASLRFYQWSHPTLSLGYFQRYADREQHAASRACAVVRRQSGGGAILHDRELTYSLAVPCGHRLEVHHVRLYEMVHDALVAVLAYRGIVARRLLAPSTSETSQSFLCFQRRSVGDVLLGDSKICGSAQRRHRGAVLQHGSMLLARSSHAPELSGIAEVAGQTCEPGEVITNWSRAIGQSVGIALEPDVLLPAEIEAAGRLEREKYAHVDWTARR